MLDGCGTQFIRHICEEMFVHATKRYLLWCANEHIEFRLPELQSIASMFNIDLRSLNKPSEDPYLIVDLNSENDAKRLMSRTILVRSCFELWGQGDNEVALHKDIQSVPSDIMKIHLGPEKSFKIRVESFNKTLKSCEKLKKIESFSYMPFEGPVDLKNADTTLHIIEYYGLNPNIIPTSPYKTFFGRWVAEGQRELISKFSLKKRSFIGSTSMDAQLSFIMVNQAQVQKGDIVVDPFVGTGSVLVAAAYRGAYVWGGDIDYLTLHAKTKPTRHNQKERAAEESIYSNMVQYGLSSHYLDVAVMDSARPAWRNVAFINAIITDPPYGIRESTERVGTNKLLDDNRVEKSKPVNQIHYPEKISYGLSEVFCDLLNFAAKHLVIGGKLVFWLPVFREDYNEGQVPSHPCLQLTGNSEQVLTVHSSRRLITMTKTRHPKETDTAIANLLDITGQFREKFFQASQMTKEERTSLKSLLPRDKRGQGLGYRLSERGTREGFEEFSPASEIDLNRITLKNPNTQSDTQS